MNAPAPHDVLPYQIAEDTFLITWGLDSPTGRSFPDAFDADPGPGTRPR
jgi:hypothetical protein